MLVKRQTEETKLKISLSQKGKPFGSCLFKENGTCAMVKVGE